MAASSHTCGTTSTIKESSLSVSLSHNIQDRIHLGADEFIKVWGDVEEDAVDGSGQSDPSEEEDEEHEVRIGGREVHHLRERQKITLLYFHCHAI